MSEAIVVGVDGSVAATRAVKWAVDDAARKHLPLRIVHVREAWPYDITPYPAPEEPDHAIVGASRMLASAKEIANHRQPEVAVTVELLDGVPAKVLREQATSGAEVVLGSRGLGGFAGALLGSVSTHVAGHAHGPVIVVRPREGVADDEVGDAGREIVVGVDDSEECEAALGYAFEQARLRRVPLRAVYAWQLPVNAYALEITADMDEVAKARYDVAARKVEAWQAKSPEVETSVEAPCAHPVTALTEASAAADLVAVGSRGRGAIGSVVLGSVSRAVLHHAHCPVAVIRS
jgi:Universal stress protein UspA and related nucleotide-binding proteins